MAAPNTAYYLNQTYAIFLKEKKLGVATAYPHFPVVLATAYPTIAALKATFYLDKIFPIKEKKDGVEHIVLLGAVEEGGTNASMHNLATRYSGWHKKIGNKKYLILNDGGLNTKGITLNEAEYSSLIFDIKIEATLKSAHYLNTPQYGFRARQRNAANTAWESWNITYNQGDYGVIAANSNIHIQSDGFATDRKGVHFQIQPFVVNAEGTYYGAILEILPTAKPITFYGDSNTYYIDTYEINIGTKLYDGADFSGYHQGPTGTGDYYIDTRYYWRYGYDAMSDTYQFLELIDSNPPVPVVPLSKDYKGWSDVDQATANNEVIYGYNTHVGTIYYNEAADTWHKSYSGTSPSFVFGALADDGYYADGDVSGVSREFYIIGGEMIYDY